MSNDFIADIFKSINRAGVNYLVLRDIDLLESNQPGKDIIVLVDTKHRRQLENILINLGFAVVSDIFPHHFAFFYDPHSKYFLKFDIIDRFLFGKRILLPFPQPYEETVLRRKAFNGNFHIPSPEDELILLLFHCISDRGEFKGEYQKRLLHLSCLVLDTGYLVSRLSQIFGSEIAWKILPRLKERDFAWLLNLNELLHFYFSQHITARSTFRGLKIVAHRILRRVVGRKGLLITLLGVADCDNFSLARNIAATSIFNSKIVTMDPRKNLLPTKSIIKWGKELFSKNNVTAPDSDESKESATGTFRDSPTRHKIFDILSFSHEFLDYYLRYFLHIYLPSRKGSLIISNCYIYDLSVHNSRYHRNRLINWMIFHLFPRPDFIFLLSPDANITSSQMQEKTGEESPGNIPSGYRYLQQNLKNCIVIPDSTSPQEAAVEITGHIWQQHFRRLGRR